MADRCILRCSGAQTMRLVRWLNAAGYDAWSPVEAITMRVPRANIKRRVVKPLMPSYVFVSARDLHDMIELANAEHGDNPRFRVFQMAGRIPIIADKSLEGLRYIEKKRTIQTRPALQKGEQVRLTDGGFAGLVATVESTQGQFATVTIPGMPFKMKVAAWCILRDGEHSAMSEAA